MKHLQNVLSNTGETLLEKAKQEPSTIFKMNIKNILLQSNNLLITCLRN